MPLSRIHLSLIFTSVLLVFAPTDTYKNPSLDDVIGFVDQFTIPFNYNGIGVADFKITTQFPEAQKYFNYGIALMHGFSPFEALRAFRQVIKIDDKCAMGYYGIYKALQWDHGYIRGRNESLIMANYLSPNVSRREQLYIQAENGNFQVYNQTFQLIFENFPDDFEAKIIWAWNTIDVSVTYFGYPKEPIRTQAQELLQELVQIYPDNAAIHHYIIHAWEDTFEPQNALNSSLVLETLTPKATHVNHMPGHIHYLIGDYKQAHEIFINSYNADKEYMELYDIGIENHWEFIHNLAFLVANLAEAGRYREAISFSLELLSLQQKHPQIQILDFNPDTSRSAARFFLQGLCSLPFVYFRYSEWESADAVLYLTIAKFSDLFNGTNTYLLDYFQSLRVWGQGMNFIQSKDYDSAYNCSVQLRYLIEQLNVTMSEKVAYDYSVVARSYFALQVQHAELVALVVENGTYDGAIIALKEAAEMEDKIPYNEPTAYPRPVLTSLAETYIAYAEAVPDRKVELLNKAIDAYQQILDSPLHVKSGFALFGIGYCYQLLGEKQKSLDTYNALLAAWPDADNSLAQVTMAKLYIATSGNSNSNEEILFYSTIALAAVLLVVIIVIIGYFLRRRTSQYEEIKSRV